ncbi:MAG: translation initiation factor, partial [Nitrospirota bacterium]|nr:translation initiation factor [Nitrospirota bacterium]
MKGRKQLPTDGEPIAWKSPFAVLKQVELPPAARSDSAARPPATSPKREKSRGRVDIIRQAAHRGGKTVTIVMGFAGISQDEKEQLAKAMQKACGTGGTVKDGHIEIQGDKRAEIARILT